MLSNGKDAITGSEILNDLDLKSAELGDEDIDNLVLSLEFQLRKSNGQWVPVDSDRVRLAPRGKK